MAQSPPIAPLEERRRRLLEESERYRQQLAATAAQLRSATAWVETGYSVVRSIQSYAPLISAALGVLRARKGRSLLGWLGNGWSLWRLGKQLLETWERSAHNP